MNGKHDNYFDYKAHMQRLMHKELMAIAMAKYNFLVKNEKWRQKYMEEEKTMTLSVDVAGLKGEPN